MRYSRPRKISTENITKEKEKPGLYIYLNRYKNPIYIGSSTRLQHRLQAILYGRADYDQISHKKKLRSEAYYYKRAYTKIEKARRIERKRKLSMKYNDG